MEEGESDRMGAAAKMLQSMEDYFRDRVAIEIRKADRMQATLTFPPDLQGPPQAGHGGGVTAMLFELVRLLRGEDGGRIRIPRPVRIEAVLHRELPLEVPLLAEVVATGGAWHSSIRQGDRLIAEAQVGPAETPLSSVTPKLRRDWEASSGQGRELPGYEFCLACGLRNPRGVQVRFDYNESLVWKRLVPRDHFRCGDGSLYPGFLCIVGDEIGWWLGALRQGECGLSNRVTICLGQPVLHGAPLLILGARSEATTTDPKGRIWQTRASILTSDWQLVATGEVQFAGSRAFTRMMLPGFQAGGDPAVLHALFPSCTGSRGAAESDAATKRRGLP